MAQFCTGGHAAAVWQREKQAVESVTERCLELLDELEKGVAVSGARICRCHGPGCLRLVGDLRASEGGRSGKTQRAAVCQRGSLQNVCKARRQRGRESLLFCVVQIPVSDDLPGRRIPAPHRKAEAIGPRRPRRNFSPPATPIVRLMAMRATGAASRGTADEVRRQRSVLDMPMEWSGPTFDMRGGAKVPPL